MMTDTNEPNQTQQDLEKLIKAQFYKMSLNIKTVLSMDECSEYTGLTKNYLYKLTHNKQIPHFKPNGKKLFFKRQDIDNWLLSNKVDSQNDFDERAMEKVFELNELIKP